MSARGTLWGDRDAAAHLVALAGLDGIGPATLLEVLEQHDPGAVWRALVAGRGRELRALEPSMRRVQGTEVEASLRRLSAAAGEVEPGAELERHLTAGCDVVLRGSDRYPRRLAHDSAGPALLFTRGRAEVLRAPTVAVVGTRNATRPGRELATELGRELAAEGVSVVSGLALGIDGAAHRGALEDAYARPPEVAAPHGPVGVVAAGLDICYPRRHEALHREVAGHGLLVSETPLGRRPVPWRFPARNRVIAGLSDAVVVVESRAVGGSILTAQEALERGVQVLAVPGHPCAPASAGTNDLLYDGAIVARNVDDVLHAIGRPREGGRRGPGAGAPPVDPRWVPVLDALGTTPAAFAEIVVRSGLDLGETAARLTELEAAGRVVRSAGWFEVVPVRPGEEGRGWRPRRGASR